MSDFPRTSSPGNSPGIQRGHVPVPQHLGRRGAGVEIVVDHGCVVGPLVVQHIGVRGVCAVYVVEARIAGQQRVFLLLAPVEEVS